MDSKKAIVWFRQDLRLGDNPALIYAVENNYRIYPIYIFDTKNKSEWDVGEAAKWWLSKSLEVLNSRLSGKLNYESGDPLEVLRKLACSLENCEALLWNRCYEPWQVARDTIIKKSLKSKVKIVKSFNGSLLFEPNTIKKKDGTPYRVFTPFFRRGCLENVMQPDLPSGDLPKISLCNRANSTHSIDKFIKPEKWFEKFGGLWTPGEHGAKTRLENFLENGIEGYQEGRNYPSLPKVSGLSPHLHFGEISVNRIWHSLRNRDKLGDNKDIDTFLTELGWREFSHNLLFFNTSMPEDNLQKKFDNFPWNEDQTFLKTWQSGMTGFPIIDAGMRQLWQTGYMHNRLRMITASFLVKNLRIDWRLGQSWFWNCLFDADLANNSAGWQWVAGCGADAAPFFRIFNPILQSKKFDPRGVYIKQFVPELAGLPVKYLHCPWDAPSHILENAGVEIGINYPNRIVDLSNTRNKALSLYKAIK